MEVRAKWSHIAISPQKLRLVCDQVRGMGAEEALVALEFMPQKGARIVHKVVASALANAENNFDLDRDRMVLATIYADGGPMLKRYKAGARGRYKPRKRRLSHLTVILEDREEE
ncbi:MAG: 50S ribosomal protein L22 [Chloroflexi bacterium]|nr:50S ribosomal protein L22 [Chloroflexota bacterium]